MNETKPWWASKVLWLNAIVAGLTVIEANTGLLQPHLPVNFYTAVALGLPAVNAVLRVITAKGLTLK